MTQDLTLSTRSRGGHTVVTLDGELDLHTGRALRDELLEIFSGYGTHALVDLTALRFCDAAGLNTLLAAQRHATRMNGSLALIGPRRPVAKVLRITELDYCFTIFPSLAAAFLEAERAAAATPGTIATPARRPNTPVSAVSPAAGRVPTSKHRGQAMRLRITARPCGLHAIVRVVGELSAHTAPKLREFLLEAMGQGWVQLIIDASGLTVVEPAGLTVLPEVRQRAQEAGGSLSLAAVPPLLVEQLAATGFEAVAATSHGAGWR